MEDKVQWALFTIFCFFTFHSTESIMYKAVFADDEIIVREGIQQKVDWNGKGFELTGVFSNGEQVVQYIQNNPDINLVISDICMPLTDGLELSKYLSEEHPHIFIVLLTGYDEFEYAQKAIKYNVKEFLLKPITAKELEDVLLKIKTRIAEIYSRSVEQQELKQMVQDSLPVLRERFLNRLVATSMDLSELEEQRTLYFLPPAKPLSMIIIADLLPKENERLLEQIATCKAFHKETDMLFFNKEDQLVCLLQGTYERELSKRSRNFSTELFDVCNAEATIGIGSITEGLSAVHESYKNAKKALAYQLILGKNRIIAFENFSNEQPQIIEEKQEIAQTLIESLKSQPSENSRHILASFFGKIFSEQASLHFAQIQIQLLLGSIIMFLEEAKIPLTPILGQEEKETILTNSLKCKEDVESWFYNIIDKIDRKSVV